MSGIFDQIINYSPPLIVSGTVNYKGTWNASTNNPPLSNPPVASTKGDYYVVSTAGTQFSISFAVGDWIISSGTAWEKVDLTDAVSSVFGRTGAVVGVSTDYSAVGLTNTAIGAANPSSGAFTSLSSSSTTTLNGTTVPASKTLVVTTDKLSALAATTSAELAGVISDETGSGALVFATSPTLVTPILGTPQSGTLTSCTGLPISTGVSGLGTGIATALAVNTGSAGAPVLFNGALGTPTSGTVTNLTGTASININGTVGATTPSTGAFTTLAATGITLTTGDFVGNSGTQILGDNGTSAAPFFSFDGDADTGAYRPAANRFGIAAGGSLVGDFTASGLAVTGALSASGASTIQNTLTITRSSITARTLTISLENGTADYISDATGAYPHRFFVGATKYAQIDTTGLAVTGALSSTGSISNTVAGSTNGAINIGYAGTTQNGINVLVTDSQTGAGFIQFRKSDQTAIGSVARVTTTDAVIFNTTSDARLKENLRDFTDSGRLIDSLKPRVFDWKNSDDNGKNVVGFVAQEEHAADPIFAHIGAVSVGDENPDTITKQWQRSDSALIPILVAELKSVRARLAALESK